MIVIPFCTHQALKVSQVFQEALDVQGWMAQKEKEETLVLEVNLDHKVKLTVSLIS